MNLLIYDIKDNIEFTNFLISLGYSDHNNLKESLNNITFRIENKNIAGWNNKLSDYITEKGEYTFYGERYNVISEVNFVRNFKMKKLL